MGVPLKPKRRGIRQSGLLLTTKPISGMVWYSLCEQCYTNVNNDYNNMSVHVHVDIINNINY